MEFEQGTLESMLKGLNELEGNLKKSFEVKGLSVGEASFLHACYLFNYFVVMDREEENKYTLTISKLEINKRKQ